MTENITFPHTTYAGGNDDDTNDDDNTQQTIHDYIGSLAFMSNEPNRIKYFPVTG